MKTNRLKKKAPTTGCLYISPLKNPKDRNQPTRPMEAVKNLLHLFSYLIKKKKKTQ